MLEVVLNLLFKPILLVSVLVGVFPVELGLCELHLGGAHLVNHLLELLSMLRDEALHLRLLTDIVALVGPKKGAVRADTDLAA